MPCIGLGWIWGTICQLQQAAIWTLHEVVLAVICGGVLWVSAYGLRTLNSRRHDSLKDPAQGVRWVNWANWLSMACLFSASALLALALINVRCMAQDHRQLVRDIEGQDLSLTGTVASLPVQGGLGVRFKFEVSQAHRLGHEESVQLPAWIDLNWYDREAEGLGDAKAWVDLKPGDVWQFVVRLKVPHGLRNPGGFDEELWLWEQGVMATGTVRSGRRDTLPQKRSSSWLFPIAQARQRVRSQIAQQLAPVDGPLRFHAGVIAALVMGDQGAISPADWDLFRATGVAHLMSISGLHITLFAWLVAQIIGAVWRGSASLGSSLCLKFPAPWVSAVGGAAVATFYALFAGWGLPAQRTILMLWVFVMTKLWGLRWPSWCVWALAFWVVVLWDPWAMLQAGFWLSFVAVGALMMGGKSDMNNCTKMKIIKPELVHESQSAQIRINMGYSVWRAVLGLAREQWVVLLALTPLSVLFFGQVSWVGILANFVAIPWVTWVITPLAMLGLVFSPCWQWAFMTLKPLMVVLDTLSALPGGVWFLPVPPLGLVIAAVCGGLVCLQTWPWSIRAWGWVWMAPAFLWQDPRPPTGQFELWFADVGQGNAVILRTAHHALLYDAGPQYSDTSDAGQRVLLPFMSHMGLQLDRLILSHRDIDHTGGAAAVLRRHTQADVLSSLEEGHALTRLRPVQPCLVGQRWRWDGVQFEILHPTPTDYASNLSSNSLSCVLRVDSSQEANSRNGHHSGPEKGGSALLVGDIEAAQERDLLDRSAIQPIDVLLVPHHGSKTSSTGPFIVAAHPSWAVIQAGYRNRYGHPAQQVLQRYEGLGVGVVSTIHCGAAHWQSEQPKDLSCERELSKRYWHYSEGG